MKRIILLAILFHFCIVLFSQQKQRNYELKFNLSEFSFNIDKGLLSISTTKNLSFYLEDREVPAIPYFPYRILRPANMSASNYQIHYEKKLIYENIDIVGNPAIYPTNVIPTNDNSFLKATKSSEDPIIWGADNILYGYSYGFFKVSPFIYDNKTRSLYFIPQITITFNDSQDGVYGDTRANTYDQEKSEEIKALILNSNELATFYPSKNTSSQKASKSASDKTVYNGTLDYLIITTEALKPVFQNLMEWKIKKGVRTSIVTVEAINNSYFNQNRTLQEKIKDFIYYSYFVYGLRWVLLGGDGTVVPIQYCEAKVNMDGTVETVSTPCDLYYGCLSAQNFYWDADGDGIIGEYTDNVNLEQHVYVTRAPVSNETEANYFVQKVIKYEKHPTTSMFYQKMLFVGAQVGSHFGSLSDAHIKSEIIYDQYINDYWSYGHSFLYDTGSNISGYSSITPNNFKELINSGFHYIHNHSHGLTNSWSFNTYNSYSISDASSQTNSEPSIFVTSSCLTNAFDSLCLSKALMNSTHGAIAYFGSSRDGFYTTSPFSIGRSLLYNSFFFNILFTGHPYDGQYRFGAVAAEVKRQFADNANTSETDGYRYLEFAINPLGDPELPLYTSTPSMFSSISITTNNANEVVVSTGSIGGCTIALVSTDNGVSYFDVVNNVSSYTFTDVYAPCRVTVTKHNYMAYESEVIKPKFAIMGNADICGTNVYSIKNLPSDCTVTWNFSNSSSPVSNLLLQNTPSQGKCTITNPNSIHINEKLNATIYKNGVSYGTASLNVSTGASFSAYFEQPGGTINGGSIVYPHMTDSIHDNQILGAFELCQIQFTSPDFVDCNFTFTGHTPSEWYLVGTTIYAKFPSVGNTMKQCVVEGHQQNGCKIFKFFINVIPSSVLPHANIANAVINSSGRKYTISLQQVTNEVVCDGLRYDVDLPAEWNLSVANATTGSILFEERVKGASTSFDASRWRPGIYVITYELNGKINTKKITIK